MSDSFDPDAWPHGSSKASNGSGKPTEPSDTSRAEDDPFSAFTFDDETADRSRTQDPAPADDDYSSFGYDFDDDPVRPRARTASGPSQQRGEFDDDPYADDPYSSQDRRDGYGSLQTTRHDEDRDDFDVERDGYDDRSRSRDDSDYDSGYDDGYDDYDNFDREPAQSGGLKRTIIGVAAIVFLIGAAGFLATFLFGGDDPPAEEAAPPSTQAPASGQDQPSVSEPGSQPSAGASQTAPPEVANTLNAALAAWGEFSVTGNVALMEPYFVPSSTQLQHFRTTEAPSIQANPPGGTPFRMTMGQDAVAVQSGNGDWAIAGTVTAARNSEPDQEFRWEFTLSRQTPSSPWQILRVRQFR